MKATNSRYNELGIAGMLVEELSKSNVPKSLINKISNDIDTSSL